MRKPVLHAWFLSLVVCTAAFAQTSPKTSEQVLRRCASAYAAADTYYEESTLSVTMGRTRKPTVRMSVAAKRPATLKVTIRRGDETVLFHDAGVLHALNAAKGTYAKAKAQTPGDLIKAAAALGGTLGTVEAFFSEDPYATITRGVSRIKPLRGALLDGARVYRIDFDQADGSLVEAYFDRKTCLLAGLNVKRLVRTSKRSGFVTMAYRITRALVDEFPKDENGEELDVLAFTAPAAEEAPVAKRHAKKEPPRAASLIGKPAPEFALPEHGGDIVRLSGLKGKAVVLVFYRAWNRNVRATVFSFTNYPYLESNPELCWFAVHDEETTSRIDGIGEKEGIPIRSLYSGGTSVQDDYAIREDPTIVFINKEGIVHKIMKTYWTPNNVRQAVNQMCDRQYERTTDK